MLHHTSILWLRLIHTLASYRIMPFRGCLRSDPSSSLRWLNVSSRYYPHLVSVLRPLSAIKNSVFTELVLQIDASLDWMHVSAGQVLWRANDASDSFYIVINGRLRAITEDDEGVVKIVAEYGQGDTAGEIDVITSAPRRNTVHAIRDTELIRMPQTLFNAISSR
jgi:CRP-like cAMP-binding protein